MRPNPLPESNRNIIGKLLLIVLASILIGALVYFVIILWAFPSFSDDWNMLEGFASVLSLSLLVGGLVFAVTEYVNAENGKHAEKLADEREKAKLSYTIYKAIFDKLTDPEQEAARRWILSNIKIKKDDEDIEKWYARTHAKIMSMPRRSKGDVPEGQRALKLTLNCFDYIGFIANHYWDMEDDSLEWISGPIAKVWSRIGPYVAHVRTLRGSKDYYLSAEYVGGLCIQWRKERGLPDEEYVEKTP